MKDCLVSISEHAFFSIVTSALEAYRLEHSIKGGGVSSCVETFGHLWGYEASDALGLAVVYRVVWADTSTAVERDRGSISYQDAAYELKESFVSNFFPEVSCLGDFHSHPYDLSNDNVKTELEVERKYLYRFSNGDFSSVKHLQGEGLVNYRVGLVVTVYERDGNKKRSMKKLDGESCVRFQYGNTTIWMKAYVWQGDIYNGFRRKADKMVRLICPSLGVNAH